MTRKPLPAELAGLPFSVSAARERGVTPDRLRGLPTPFRGVRAPSAIGESPVDLARAFAPRLREGHFFSHRTAGQLWGIPLPGFAARPLHVASMVPARPPTGKNVIGHAVQIDAADLVELNGLPVPSAARTWAFLAEDLPLHELVAAGEFLITGSPIARIPPLTTLDDLRQMAQRLGKRRGSHGRSAALGLMRQGPLSRPESLVRYVLVKSGIPEPEINIPCLDSDARIVAVPDMRWPVYGVALEYEGDYHRDTAQFRRDIHRLERLVDHGWIVIKVSADDLFARPDDLVARVARRLQSRGWHGNADFTFLGHFER